VCGTRDGQQALDYLYRRGNSIRAPGDNPAVMLLDLKLPKVDGLSLAANQSDERLKMNGGGADVIHEEKDVMRSYASG